MDVFDAARTVLAVRAFQDKPIPREVIEEIVESARLTGSSVNGQPWLFIVIQDRNTLNRLGKLAKTGPYISQAPMAVAVVIEKTKYSESDASRAIQSMMLTAWSHGVGSNWVGFYNLDQVKPILAIPDHLQILAIIPFGYPQKNIGKGKKQRKPISEVVYLERFGQPFK